MKRQATMHGLMVEFLTAQEILEATRRVWRAGFREMDAYTPYPVEGLAVTLGMKKEPDSGDHFCWWHCRCDCGICHADLFDVGGLSAECRRAATQQLAGVHTDYF